MAGGVTLAPAARDKPVGRQREGKSEWEGGREVEGE